jgi:hypothetical protein
MLGDEVVNVRAVDAGLVNSFVKYPIDLVWDHGCEIIDVRLPVTCLHESPPSLFGRLSNGFLNGFCTLSPPLAE